MKYQVIIIGAGPAGLFSTYRLACKAKVAIFEMGREIEERICQSNSRQTFSQRCLLLE